MILYHSNNNCCSCNSWDQSHSSDGWPQLPKRDCPTDDPTKPANTFATIPIELPFLVILPATSPIRPPAMIDHNIAYPPFLF